ncbi:polysaccharide biosynthesis protein [Sphingorhabdus sp.]|uniref:polysaccharide biosynthesis protein n=1 Tax=Sphingorhabdus sp. TaxID=1902408 RepID=UPI003982E641
MTSKRKAATPKISANIIAGLSVVANLDRRMKKIIAFVVDSAICVFAIWLAFSLRLGDWQLWNAPIRNVLVASFFIWPPIFLALGIYRSIFRFAGSGTLTELARAIAIYLVFMTAIFTIIGLPGVPRTLGILVPILFFLGLVMSRIVVRYIISDLLGQRAFGGETKRVLIYGAGSAGQQLALSTRHYPGMFLLGFVDDDRRLRGQRLDGSPVYHSSDLVAQVERLDVTDILLAVPSMSRSKRKGIVDDLKRFSVHVQTLPQIQDIVAGKVSIADLREVEVDDLLGRDAVAPNDLLMGRTILSKTVMVTGAGGSIGSELCRQIMAIGPQKLVLVEMTEYALYKIEQELRENAAAGIFRTDIEIHPELINTTAARPVSSLLAAYCPDTIFHAAAYKHVPLLEHNPISGMGNNIISTRNLVQAAEQNDVAHFILISTDKAVRPTNVMGASKRVCEQILQAKAKVGSKTRFSMVRFGNVLGSSGSVVPKFKEQIANGGPVTLTHKDIIRYFMTIPEAAQLVIQAGSMAKGGEVFVLDMGKPVKIYDLASTLINLSGLTVRDNDNPDGDIAIEEIGLRPGEKLFEELLIGENPMPTKHKRIMQALEGHIDWRELSAALDRLEQHVHAGNRDAAVSLLRELVPEYQPNQDGLTGAAAA